MQHLEQTPHNACVDLQRRALLFFLLASGAAGRAQAQPASLAARVRAGGCVVLLRHARTTPGVGDPAGFDLTDCGTQRNLSDQGKAQSRAIGAWFRNAALRPRAVRSSAWCRCRDTAALAFGACESWPALNSTFNAGAESASAAQALRDALLHIPRGAFEVWVTHQVNITALTGAFAEMGEGVIVDSAARVVARSRFG
jgi:phosphohistidine phosphatase SixA